MLFAGLLKHHAHKGPAEIPRIHTYPYCAWWAARAGIALRVPPRHPFNPLPTLRLLVAGGADPALVDGAFAFIWAPGRDPEQEWQALCAQLGVADADRRVVDPEVKARLQANTDRGIREGVYGVPSLVVGTRIFWGRDTIDGSNDVADDPGLFQSPALRQAAAVAPGVQRRR